jgi:hypothetical protein
MSDREEEASLRIVRELVRAARHASTMSRAVDSDELDIEVDRLRCDLVKHATYIHPTITPSDNDDKIDHIGKKADIGLDELDLVSELDLDDLDLEKCLIDKYADDDVDRDHVTSRDRRDDPV